MKTIEMRNTLANAGVFGGIGYGLTEALKEGAKAVGSSKVAFFAKDALPLGNILAMNPLHTGGVTGLFVLIDALARRIINNLNGREKNPMVLDLARMSGSVALTGLATTALGITTSIGAAAGLIVVALATYAVVQRVVESFHAGVYNASDVLHAAKKA